MSRHANHADWLCACCACRPSQDGVLCYCRLALALGGVPSAAGSMSLQEWLSLVTREINTPAFTW
jgi:hypothetical protein